MKSGLSHRNEYSDSFAAEMADVLERRGMTRYALARIIERSWSTMDRVLGKTRTPTRDLVEDIIEALHMEPVEADRLRLAGGFAPKHVKGLTNDTNDSGARPGHAHREAQRAV